MESMKQPVLYKQECLADKEQQSLESTSVGRINHSGSVILKNIGFNNCFQSGEIDSAKSQASVPMAPLINYSSVRTIRMYYRPSAIKRMRKHGLEKRLSKKSQREILFRRVLAGRIALTTFDRFMNELPECYMKTGGKRVNLSDKEKGYKSVLKKKDRFRFTEL